MRVSYRGHSAEDFVSRGGKPSRCLSKERQKQNHQVLRLSIWILQSAESDPVTLKLVAQIPKTRLENDSWTNTDTLVGKELLDLVEF